MSSTQIAGEPTELSEREAHGYWRESLARFSRTPSGVLGAVLLLALALSAIFAPVLSPFDPNNQSLLDSLQAPSGQHPFGTDQFGRDVLSRVLYGGRVSMPVGFIAMGIAAVLGIPLGLAAGYYGRRIDSVIMRLMDIMLAFPGILLALVIIAILGPSLTNVMISVGISGVPGYARLVRGSVMQVRGLPYVEAARASGVSDFTLILRHILPNILAPVIVLASLGVGYSILAASGLSFLGLGAQPPSPEWGAMLSTGQNYLQLAWWITTFPGLLIILAVLAMNLLGDALRDSLDSRLGKH